MDYFRFQQALKLLDQQAATRTPGGGPDAPRAAGGANAPADRFHRQALALARAGNIAAALEAWERALGCDCTRLDLFDAIVDGLRGIGQEPAVVLDRAWPRFHDRQPCGIVPQGWRDLLQSILLQCWEDTLPLLQAESEAYPSSRRRAGNLAFVLRKLGAHGRAHCVLAANLGALGKWGSAAELYLSAPATDAQSPLELARFLFALRHVAREDLVLKLAQSAAARGECSASAYVQWAETLIDLHRDAEALAVLDDGARALDSWRLRLQAGLILPPVPHTQEAMERAHARCRRHMLALDDALPPTDPDELASLADALEPNFYLGYRGEPDIDETAAFGRFVHRVMVARYPAYGVPIARTVDGARRLRIGYAVDQASALSPPMRFVTGWLEHADQTAFEIHLFPIKPSADRLGGYVADLVEHAHEPAATVEHAASVILNADLDVLIYPEIGMAPRAMQLAALRLAPAQCVANGHSVTTGLPTVDYFISNDAMEPDDAAGHYTERLVTLPGIGLCLPEVPLPASPTTRDRLGLPDNAAVYLVTQSAFKFIPCNDSVFARIARHVDNALFVFNENEFTAQTAALRERIFGSFRAFELDPEMHVRFLPHQGFEAFQSLNMASDVYLDPIGWSGSLTALDAISCGLPVVAFAGKLMRSRQSCGWLKQMGMEETIAHDLDDYVRIAVRLGQDRRWRDTVAQRIVERRHLLFNDKRSVRSLEAFLRWAAGTEHPGDRAMFRVWAPSGSGPRSRP